MEAWVWLHKELELNGLNWISVARLEPVFIGLHDDPRWQVLLEKAGLSDTHLSSINFNMTLLDY